MKITYWIYSFKDCKGNKDLILIENEDDYVYLDGLVDLNEEQIEEEMKANDIEDYLSSKGVEVRIVKKTCSFEDV